MAKGLKVWATGDILQASDVNDYLSEQVVMNYADEAARDAAIAGGTTLVEGMAAYSGGTGQINSKTMAYYDGTNWIVLGTKAAIEAQESRTARIVAYMEVY